MAFQLSKPSLDHLERYLRQCPKREAGLMVALHLVQKERGYVPDEAIDYLVQLLGSSRAHVEGVLTFYTMYRRRPPAQHQVGVCSTLSCAMAGAGKVVKAFEKELGLKAGEITQDGAFGVEKVECLAACDKAPVLMVNDDLYEKITPEKVSGLLAKLGRNGRGK